MEKYLTVKSKLERFVKFFESILSAFILIGVFIGVIDLIKYLRILFDNSFSEAYMTFQSYLGHILLLVIGLELILMLIKHTTESIFEVLTLAIARKILISANSFLELLLGVLSILLLFVIRKYFHSRNLEYEAEKGILVGAATKIGAVNKALNTFIPEDIAETIGGVVARLVAEHNKNLLVGVTVKIADVGLTIVRMEDGVIEKIKVYRLKEK